MTNCLFFGDSITYGEYDGVLGGWVDCLKRHCLTKFNEGKKEVLVFNLGIGGETTIGFLKRFETELTARKSAFQNLIFISYGANDLAVLDNEAIVPAKDYEANIRTAIKKAKEHTPHVFVISILPISEKIDDIKSPNGKLRSNAAVNLYNGILQKIAKEESVIYLDLHSVFSEQAEDWLSKDGLHPNEKGYRILASEVEPILEKYL